MPQMSQIHIDTALTDLSIRYMNEELIADDVAPPLPVAKRSDKYFIYDPTTFLSGTGTDAKGKPNSLRRPGTPPVTMNFTISTDSYYAEEYAIDQLVTDAEIRYADNPLQPDIDATLAVTERLKIDNEIAVATLVGTRANYGSANKAQLTTGATGTSWAQYASANSHPFTNIQAGIVQVYKGIQRAANTILLTLDSAYILADHPDYKDLYKYTAPEGLTFAGVAKNIRGLNTVVGVQQRNTAPEGAAFTSGNVWVDDQGEAMALIYYRSSDTGPRTIHTARTFEAPDDTTQVRGFQVRRYRWERLKGQYIECSVTRDWKFIAKDSSGLALGAYLISGTTL